MNSFFTARTVGGDKESLMAIRAGAAWVYTDAPSTFLEMTEVHADIVAHVLTTQPLCQFSYLYSLCRQEPMLAAYEREYIGYAANLACARGKAEKLLCQTAAGSRYVCYVATEQSPRIADTLDLLHRRLQRAGVLHFKDTADEVYGGVTGSYYWVKGLLEHLIYLGLASAWNTWSVSR